MDAPLYDMNVFNYQIVRKLSRPFVRIYDLSQDLRSHTHVNNITARGNGSLGFIRSNLRGCKPTVKTKAYNATVRPILDYASTVCDPFHNHQIAALEYHVAFKFMQCVALWKAFLKSRYTASILNLSSVAWVQSSKPSTNWVHVQERPILAPCCCFVNT